MCVLMICSAIRARVKLTAPQTWVGVSEKEKKRMPQKLTKKWKMEEEDKTVFLLLWFMEATVQRHRVPWAESFLCGTGRGAEKVSRGAWLLRLLSWLNRKKRLCVKPENFVSLFVHVHLSSQAQLDKVQTVWSLIIVFLKYYSSVLVTFQTFWQLWLYSWNIFSQKSKTLCSKSRIPGKNQTSDNIWLKSQLVF